MKRFAGLLPTLVLLVPAAAPLAAAPLPCSPCAGVEVAEPFAALPALGAGPALADDALFVVAYELPLDEAATPAAAHALAVIKRSVAAGVLLIRAGLYSNCIRFMPPLSITEDELREAVAIVAASLAYVEEHGP